MTSRRLTMAQALIAFLKQQSVERDGQRQPFFAGCLGIFGHGNLAGIGQALQENPDFRYYQGRNEQSMVHTAVAYARAKNRLQTIVCTSSIGPGATNMVTGAALATINRLPVLLLPGDIFATRTVAPVLQQLESEHSQDVSVNDCFCPVSRYWDRINRPEQLITSLPEAMRVLTSPAETGAVTLCLPQDVQAEAYDYPEEFFAPRTWAVQRQRADRELLRAASYWISCAEKPLIIAGGGVTYSDANEALARFASNHGIPVAETQAGKGAIAWDHDMCVGAVGATGTAAANILAREADLVIGIGTRYSDFTTASKTAFQNPKVRFVNINVCGFDSFKHNALPIVSDARAALTELDQMLMEEGTSSSYRQRIKDLRVQWNAEVDEIYKAQAGAKGISQGEVIGCVNEAAADKGVVVCAAGSMPGDLHKLWRSTGPGNYHVEYGFSCMGYEIAGGMGVSMAQPDRDVYVMVGDGSYLMMAQEIVTAVQERIRLTVVLVDNHGFGSIGALSRSLGSEGFGTEYRYRNEDGTLKGEHLPIDFAANAASMGATVFSANDRGQFERALADVRNKKGPSVIVVTTDPTRRVGGYESWWDVPVAEVSQIASVQAARKDYEKNKLKERACYPSTAGSESTSMTELIAGRITK